MFKIDPKCSAIEIAASFPDGNIKAYNNSSKVNMSSFLKKADVPPIYVAILGIRIKVSF